MDSRCQFNYAICFHLDQHLRGCTDTTAIANWTKGAQGTLSATLDPSATPRGLAKGGLIPGAPPPSPLRWAASPRSPPGSKLRMPRAPRHPSLHPRRANALAVPVCRRTSAAKRAYRSVRGRHLAGADNA
ncbi:hypothetical protein ACQY0O_000008 [Thecaphora frezii]